MKHALRLVPILALAGALTALGCAESTTSPPEVVDGGTDAGPAMTECEPGAFGNLPCGLCGVATRVCSRDGRWGELGSCASEGPCMPGSEETRTAERCGQEERDCNDACEWNEWELVVPGEGVCEPGWERVSSEACAEGLERAETCAEDCTWQGGPCIDECGDTPVREPLLAMEVCVPAGLFIRGGDTYPDTDPEATVRLSAYYIDRYPATNARYRECVDARACDRPSVDGWDWFDDETLANSPVTGLTWAQARAFCQWMDRRLPTEAEWEKAARGPYPNRRAWPWGNTWDCDVLDADLCDDRSYGSGRPLVAVDSAPELASPFGTELQAGGAYEWTSDYYDAEYYSRMSSREDPTGPSAPSRPDLGHVLRGQPSYAVQEGDDLTQRSARGEDRGLVQEGVRCARTPGE